MSTPRDIDQFNRFGADYLPGHLGIEFIHVARGEARARFTVHRRLMAPNGYLHAGAVVALADSCAGYGCVASYPEGANGFTTIELKSNHLGTAGEGAVVECAATAAHLGRTTQVWDAVVSSGGRTVALFRCTQMLLYPK
jgi:uncharacterized protein (TIGR00369 family)